MHKLFSAIAISTLLAIGSANATPPHEIVVTDVLEIQPGEMRSYEFDESVDRIGTAIEGVAQISAQTDRTFTILGLNEGEALVSAQAPDGRIIHRMMVRVAIPGRLVKIYHPSDNEGKYYDSFRCTPNHGCGRENPDIPKPASTSTTVTKRLRDGGSISTTKSNP